jgi:cystathionine beta-lyase
VQALTKYASGGADLLMGSVTTRDPARIPAHQASPTCGWVGRRRQRRRIGAALLPSLEGALCRARIVQPDPRDVVEGAGPGRAVPHPALPDSPGHASWQALCTRAAGLFSIVFDERFSARGRCVRRCAAPVQDRLFVGRSGPASWSPTTSARCARAVRWRGTLVRFSIGLEGVDDLIEDARQALDLMSTA